MAGTRRFRKTDVDTHREGFGRRVPAVNVKVRHGLNESLVEQVRADNGADQQFTLAWIEEHLSGDEQSEWWWIAVDEAREHLTEDAKEIFGQHTEVYFEGRSGGWATLQWVKVCLSSDVGDWDAIDLMKWARFVKACTLHTEDVAYLHAVIILFNVFEPWLKAQRKRELEAHVEALDGTVGCDLPIEVA